MKTRYIFFPLLIVTLNSFSQNIAENKADFSYGSIIDTIEVGKYTIKLKSLWETDTITISKYYEPSVIDTNFFRVLHNDKSYIPSLKEIEEHNEFFATSAQNCHSYALEMYFRSNCPSKIGLFNNGISIHAESYKKILDKSFDQIHEFKVTKRGKLQPNEPLKDSSLLVFYNNYDMISHSVYYENNLFYTKNGALKSGIVTRISELFKSYLDTKYVRVYSFKKKK
ncbi:MAG: hypothetical protein AB7S48_00955 [Bacteroidales bacterium]